MARNLKFLNVQFCLLLCGLILFAACTDQIDEEPLLAGKISTATPKLLATFTPTPTASPSTTATAHPSSPPTAMATASRLSPTSAVGDNSNASDDKLATSFSQSADGRWIAEGWLDFNVEDGILMGYDTILQVSQADGPVTWTLADYLQNPGLGATIPEIVRWSSDGQYAYFSNRSMTDGCGDFVNGSDLFKADLETGEVIELMPPLARSLSLSPDESIVAYLPWGSMPDLVLRNVVTGSQRTLVWDIVFDVAGYMVWSPDGQSVAMTLSSSSCPFPGSVHSIAVVDVETLTPTIVLQNDESGFVTAAWSETGDLVLQDLDGERWALDVTTSTLTQIR